MIKPQHILPRKAKSARTPIVHYINFQFKSRHVVFLHLILALLGYGQGELGRVAGGRVVFREERMPQSLRRADTLVRSQHQQLHQQVHGVGGSRRQHGAQVDRFLRYEFHVVREGAVLLEIAGVGLSAGWCFCVQMRRFFVLSPTMQCLIAVNRGNRHSDWSTTPRNPRSSRPLQICTQHPRFW